MTTSPRSLPHLMHRLRWVCIEAPGFQPVKCSMPVIVMQVSSRWGWWIDGRTAARPPGARSEFAIDGAQPRLGMAGRIEPAPAAQVVSAQRRGGEADRVGI